MTCHCNGNNSFCLSPLQFFVTIHPILLLLLLLLLLIIIITMEICTAPILRLKTLNKHTHIMYIEMENVIKIKFKKSTYNAHLCYCILIMLSYISYVDVYL